MIIKETQIWNNSSRLNVWKNLMGGGILSILLCACSHSWQEKYESDEFMINDRKCVVVRPNVEPNGEWIVRPAFMGAFPYVDDSLLCRGYTFAFYDVTHDYGSPKAQSDFIDFYEEVKEQYNLSDKFIMEGFSRGGFFALMYSIYHPEQIDKLYVDAPVCDLHSWPMRQDKKLYHDADSIWQSCGIDIDSIADFPIRTIDTLINRNIPIICVYGDNDTIVPYRENFGRIQLPQGMRYKVIRKEGCGHHPHSLQECGEIVDFLTRAN